jgi:coenzyme Q-binding protein COQ10
MPQASVKRLIEVEKENLIDLVLDIDKYPSFIPYCINSKVYKREDKGENIFIIADLTIGKGIFKDTYKSDVRFSKKNDTIYVTNIDGPLN